MAHQSHIKKERYRQWVKAGLGLGYLKEGLSPFCDDVSTQQHADILDNIKRVKNVPSVICGTCTLKTLQPDHVKLGNKQCPYGHTNCNCCYTSGKTLCPNNVCGAIYDSIISYHASTPPAPNWKNAQTQQWTTDPWSIAKCFINAPGYEQKTSAADTDCTGLLHVIINNKYFHKHVSCSMTGPNIFSKVRQYRNEIFHSSTMELDSQKTNSYIDDMIAVLQDGKELIHRQDAKEAVKKLQDLKNEDFVITTEDVEKVREDMDATKEDCTDLKLKVATLETFISELKEDFKKLKEDSSKNKTDFDTLKADLREKLIEEYRQNLLQVSAMPCQPEHLYDFKEVYVTPRIIIKSKDKDRKEISTEVESLSDIFIKDGKPSKSIYILGEAGSGKSSFCKMLVHDWCIAHSTLPDLEGQQAKRPKLEALYTDDYFDGIKEMKNFEFLFFISLRNCIENISIKDMLDENYRHSALKELIERESETCLVVLDGLDEWTSKTTYPPKVAKFSKYTVLTTSRPWKIGSLGISNTEMRQTVYIEGLNGESTLPLVRKTLAILEKEFPDREKDYSFGYNCYNVLAKEHFCSFSQTPMLTQQLICLWFDGRLHETSRCNIYTCMLDLFFVWYKKKVPDVPLFNDILNKSRGLVLPNSFNKTEECKSHSYIIQGVARLAYETLIKNEKEKSLTFDSSMFQQLEISDEIKDSCLKLGILSEEKGQSLSASRSRKSHFSFIHKSVQEFLVAVYIVLHINTEQESPLDTERHELSDYLSKMLNVKTVDEVLEQENVVIMLCGLEPRLAKFISKFVYGIVSRDEHFVTHRTKIHSKYRHYSLITNMQNLILKCIEETKASNEINEFSFDLGDLVILLNQDTTRLCEVIDEQNITLDSVISISITNAYWNVDVDVRIFECIRKCKNIETIKMSSCCKKIVYDLTWDYIEANASTLKMFYVKYSLYHLYVLLDRSPFRHIADMTNLVALEVGRFTVTHEDFTSLCTFLSGSGNLQQISICIQCECKQQHEVDLSKHRQLQHLEYNEYVVVTNAEFKNVEIISCLALNRSNYVREFDFLGHFIESKEFTLAFDFPAECTESPRCNDASDLYATVTRKLVTFLSSLHQVRELNLSDFIFTDNIIQCAVEMKSLESINLYKVTMSFTTWRKLVDSVAALPQSVKVKAYDIYLKGDGEECNPVLNWVIGETDVEKAAALQYVEEHEALCVEIDLYPDTAVFSKVFSIMKM